MGNNVLIDNDVLERYQKQTRTILNYSINIPKAQIYQTAGVANNVGDALDKYYLDKETSDDWSKVLSQIGVQISEDYDELQSYFTQNFTTTNYTGIPSQTINFGGYGSVPRIIIFSRSGVNGSYLSNQTGYKGANSNGASLRQGVNNLASPINCLILKLEDGKETGDSVGFVSDFKYTAVYESWFTDEGQDTSVSSSPYYYENMKSQRPENSIVSLPYVSANIGEITETADTSNTHYSLTSITIQHNKLNSNNEYAFLYGSYDIWTQ